MKKVLIKSSSLEKVIFKTYHEIKKLLSEENIKFKKNNYLLEENDGFFDLYIDEDLNKIIYEKWNDSQMFKTSLPCCALAQLSSINNRTTTKALENEIQRLTQEALNNTEVGVSTGNGQTAVFSIISPGEEILEKKLKDLGFVYIHTFKRRIGYPPGNLKMYIKNLI